MKLNKRTKALVTLAAGAALLTGTAGTFALWYDVAPLTGAVDEIHTGDLHLTGAPTGAWYWANQSYGTDKVGTPFTGTASRLVPGDGVKYVWGTNQPTIHLQGDTIVANLYLDGFQVTPADLAPLVVLVGGLPADTTVTGGLMLSGITATNISNQNIQAALPQVTIGFPLHRATPGAAVTPVMPGEEGTGYARRKDFTNVLHLRDVQIRLQQEYSATAFGE